jgi:hypothetical protein
MRQRSSGSALSSGSFVFLSLLTIRFNFLKLPLISFEFFCRDLEVMRPEDMQSHDYA